MKTYIAIVAALLAIAGNVPYLRDIIQKKVKPHPYTWASRQNKLTELLLFIS
jgi:uncharacterized membrane protein